MMQTDAHVRCYGRSEDGSWQGRTLTWLGGWNLIL